MSEPTVLYGKRGAVAQIALNRPAVLNAYNVRMRDELFVALEAARDDPDVRAALISGSGERAFCAGADLTEFGSAPSQLLPVKRAGNAIFGACSPACESP